MTSRILLLTGMTPDRRIFDRLLPLLPTAAIVDWIRPTPYESIASYAKRLSVSISPDDSTVVCGVSFGGIVARELATCLNAKACVLISSVRSPRELPPKIRALRILAPPNAQSAMKVAGVLAAYWPRPLKTRATWRMMKLNGPSGEWYRWATAAVLDWQPSADVERIRLFQIHGDRDATFPVRYVDADLVIHGGGHILTLTHSVEVAHQLAQFAA